MAARGGSDVVSAPDIELAEAPAARAGFRDRITAGIARGLIAAARRGKWPENLKFGERLGDLARTIGLRRRVARENLALAFPEKSDRERDEILREHYHELGRVCIEYARFAGLANAPPGEVLTRITGAEHLQRVREEGRGAILLTGHFGNFELMGAMLAKIHPTFVVVKPLSNPLMDEWITAERSSAALRLIPIGSAMRGAFAALKANHWIEMVADQDARRHGVFVPFFGRLASTPVGPAELALRARAPIVMGFGFRLPDGRFELRIDPPLTIDSPKAPDAAQRLTAAHTARLEAMIRERPSAWFWLHRRWKTPPP